MKIKVKDKIFNIVESYDKVNDFYSYKAVNKNNEEMGFINFRFTSIYGKRCVWLYKIEVKEQFQHKGVGQSLLYAMEYTAYMKRVSVVMAKFFPDNMYAYPFYIKNGYCIFFEENGEMEKRLDFDLIKYQSQKYYVNENNQNNEKV